MPSASIAKYEYSLFSRSFSKFFSNDASGTGFLIRRYLARWNGKIAIRSGTARIAIVPQWDDDVPLKEGLPAFPGAQVLIIIPEQGSTKR